MRNVKRYDRSRLDKAERTPQGFLRAPAFLTRVGVFTYRKADGSVRREFRPPEEVFKPESMASLVMAPLTNDHPNEAVSPGNVRQFQIGVVGEQILPEDDQFISAHVTVMDAAAIKDVESGVVELSCGYDCDEDETPGTYMGEAYDIVQRNIRYNHVALVPRGRAGREVKLRLDSRDAIQLTEETAMEEIEINGQKFQVAPELAAAIKAHMAKMTEDAKKDMAPAADLQKAQEEKAAAEGEKADAQKKVDETQAKLDSANAELAKRNDSSDKIEAIAKELIKVRAVAKTQTKLDHVEIEKKSINDLKSEVLKANKVDITGKSQDYINARFDSISELHVNDEAKADEQRKAFENRFNPRKDAAAPDSVKARDAMVERQKNKWKTPAATADNK